MNAIRSLTALGQSIWCDYLSRELLDSGELGRWIAAGDITGITSNPAIFQSAMLRGTAYAGALGHLVARGMSASEVYEALAVQDIRGAADALTPVHEATGGRDGHVSLEVAPGLAYNEADTVSEARRLWHAVNRANLLIKVPATAPGVRALETLIAEGISVNATLIFSVARYVEIARAYARGLRRWREAGGQVGSVASVASFFVSRIDTAVDSRLPATSPLRGQAAIANAKRAFRAYQQLLDAADWRELAAAGAQPQRLLWASTSTKNPAYRDVLYVEELVGPGTVNTVPVDTLAAFKDHGRAEQTLQRGLAEADQVVSELAAAGIDLEAVCAELERQGVEAFSKAFTGLLSGVGDACRAHAGAAAAASPASTVHAAAVSEELQRTIARLQEDAAVQRLWNRDTSLWGGDPQARQAIGERLGWLSAVADMRARVPEIETFAAEARQAGFRSALLLGMGGSSLCTEVIRSVFGVRDGFLDVRILDSTSPEAVATALAGWQERSTLFLVASKSGTTTEVDAFYRYFRGRVSAGASFVAITDPGTPLARLAAEEGFRKTFLNAPDIGGRFSALSYFGLVPAALLGVDLPSYLARAEAMAAACSPWRAGEENPGLVLGALLGAAAAAGRDKLALVFDSRIRALGAWVEQLVAESTGKMGKGILPLVDESPAALARPRADELAVVLTIGEESAALAGSRLAAMAETGLPVLHVALREPADVGAELFRWEVATAMAGAALGINPFDEPNVKESKVLTAEFLSRHAAAGGFGSEHVQAESEELRVVGTGAAGDGGGEVTGLLRAHVASAGPGDYIALLAYLPPTPEIARGLHGLAARLASETGVAVTYGFGPRFLHSTGQLHKGGPNTGVFLQLTCDEQRDVPIPGLLYGFSVLKQAQALGDFSALERRGRRLLRCHLKGSNLARGLERLARVLL
ncbi:MAG: bifunctional transaldolase/phosoglucose isomerase [Candidatus Schekmanbacteria bacterium]|nr:bifunctional transaldolase/phosoglucose isomerase [Candidatus Schekmanbacteria bacterium]